MPGYPFDNLGDRFKLELPPRWPWKTKQDQGLVWDREPSARLLKVIQELASLYGKWIVPLIECGPEAELLVAASLSIPRLRQLVEGVTCAILVSLPHHRPPRRAISHDRTKQSTEEEAHTGLMSMVAGIQCMSLIMAGKEDAGSLEQLANLSDARYAESEENPSRWSPLIRLANALFVRAMEDDWAGMRLRLQSVPMANVLQGRLESGLRLAAKELLGFSKRVTWSAPGTVPECDAYKLALAVLRDVMADDRPQAWPRWCVATEQVHTAGQDWRRVDWVEAHGSHTNESLRVQMLKKEAHVRQYALMMPANGQRLGAIKLLKALHMLLQSARRDAVRLGGKWSGKPSKRLRKLFDIDIVEPDVRERWESALAGPLKKCRSLIRIATRDGQQDPWALRDHYGQFVKKGVVGGRSEAYRKRRLVEELLAPMQALGLGANMPWEQLLQADVSERRSRKRRACLTLDTCHGKAWVVNPLGIVSPPRKRSSKR